MVGREKKEKADGLFRRLFCLGCCYGGLGCLPAYCSCVGIGSLAIPNGL